MRNVSIQDFENHPADFVAEVEAGARLTLVRGGKPIAEVVPVAQATLSKWASEEERLAAVADMMAFMKKGINMGGFKITDRDALYDRD
jgi:prevent-host-death family protein